jgi:hypothetical protein
MDRIEELIEAIKVPPQDPQFYPKVFSLISKQNKAGMEKESSGEICLEEYDNLSKRLDRSQLQESCSVRNVLRARRIAISLINDKGDILMERIPGVIKALEKCLYSLGPQRQYDAIRQEQLLSVLRFLLSSKEAPRLLKAISKPISHRHAEEIIRATLQLPGKEVINDAHTRRAVLSSWLCYLRQNVGSCFATAPAIIIHDEQPLQYLKDLNEILSTGRLKRTFGGVEYTAPLSISWGAGDLKKNILVPYTSEGRAAVELWLSPGLIAAFEAANLVGKELPLKQKIEEVKNLITEVIPSEKDQQFFIINAEDILRGVLLKYLKLTEADLKEYENRSRMAMQTTFLTGLPSGSARGKTEACASFYVWLELAENAFKGLADNALLKAWEFTLASFAETKAGFTRWNLYSSLGFRHEEAGGIGFSIYDIITRKIEQSKIKIQDLQIEYEQKYAHLKYLEGRMQRAGSEKELEWIKIDYKTKMYEFNILEELRDSENDKAQRTANMFNLLNDAYYELFPQYFQEVYDADMHEVTVGQYDDSPAGFRLLFKHGRSNTSQWTYIRTPAEFIQSLSDFFIATEIELASRDDFKGLERELTEIVTAIVTHIKTEEFLETAFYRMAAAHQSRIVKNPLENLDKIEKKPWAYTSGGSMATLVSCFFGLEDKPFEISRWVENPMELLVFLIDTVKQIPHKLMNDYINKPNKSMLIHSPTHAFLMKPGLSPFKEAWQNESFTYTWARDHLVKPIERFVDNLILDEAAQEFLIAKLSEQVPINYQYFFRQSFLRMHGDMGSVELRNHIVDTMQKEKGLQFQRQIVLQPDEIDHFLYEALPLFPTFEMGERIRNLLEKMPLISKNRVNDIVALWEKFPSAIGGERYATAQTLQDIVKGLLCLELQKTSTPQDLHAAVAEAARGCDYAFPKPILFADTNWTKDYFGFTVSPGTGKLELWRFDLIGTIGYPMSSWAHWLNGTRKDITWGIYTRPYEYIK